MSRELPQILICTLANGPIAKELSIALSSSYPFVALAYTLCTVRATRSKITITLPLFLYADIKYYGYFTALRTGYALSTRFFEKVLI
jgi:hypothetical protein